MVVRPSPNPEEPLAYIVAFRPAQQNRVVASFPKEATVEDFTEKAKSELEPGDLVVFGGERWYEWRGTNFRRRTGRVNLKLKRLARKLC